MKIENADLLYLNAACGMIIIILLFLKSNSFFIGGGIVSLALIFSLGEFVIERQKITTTDYRPPSRSKKMIEFDRKLVGCLFILNLVAIFIIWFPPPFPSDPIAVLWPLFLYFGFIMLLLKWSFGKLGTEMARSKYHIIES